MSWNRLALKLISLDRRQKLRENHVATVVAAEEERRCSHFHCYCGFVYETLAAVRISEAAVLLIAADNWKVKKLEMCDYRVAER